MICKHSAGWLCVSLEEVPIKSRGAYYTMRLLHSKHVSHCAGTATLGSDAVRIRINSVCGPSDNGILSKNQEPLRSRGLGTSDIVVGAKSARQVREFVACVRHGIPAHQKFKANLSPYVKLTQAVSKGT